MAWLEDKNKTVIDFCDVSIIVYRLILLEECGGDVDTRKGYKAWWGEYDVDDSLICKIYAWAISPVFLLSELSSHYF